MKNKEDFLSKEIVVAFLAILCCLLWGTAFPCIKIGYGLFNIASTDTASQILFAGCRFTLAGILTVLLGSMISKRTLTPKKDSWGMIFILCLAQTVVQYYFFYVGLAHTSGIKASIISGANVFFAILISALIFHYEKMGAVKLIGVLLGFAGVVVINLDGTGIDASMSFMGEGFILISTVSSAISSVLIKKFSMREDPVTLSGYQFIVGGLLMVIGGLAMGGRLTGFSPKAILLLVYMAMISAVAYSIWGILLKHNPVGKVTVYGFTNPIFGVITSAIFLNERNQAFTMQGLIALALVCVGIFMVNKESAKDKINNA